MCQSKVWRSNRERALAGEGKTWPSSRIDPCITHLINALNANPHLVTLASCCGHDIYPLTVIVKDLKSGRIFELLTNKTIKGRTKKFYKADAYGRYFVPEVSAAQ